MKLHLYTALPLSVLALAGCPSSSSSSGTTSTTSSAAPSAAPLASAPPVTSSSATPQTEGREHGGPRMRKGPGQMYFRAARDLTDLKEPQKASLEKIMETLKEQPGSKPEFKDFQAELLTEVKAGKIEQAKLDPKIKAIETAMQTRLDGEADNLTKLHDLLEPAQRKALTAAVAAKQAKMEAHFMEMKDAGVAPPKAGDITRLKVTRITNDLGLDAAQDKAIDAVVAKATPKAETPGDARTEWKAQASVLSTAFEKDAFDAKKQDFFSKANKKGHEGLQDQVDLLTLVVPVLKPEQREKLAAKLEHPSHTPQGGPEGHVEPHYGFEKHWTGPWQEEDGEGHGGGGNK